VVDGVGEEVGVDEDLVGGSQGGVVVEEHVGWDLWAGAYMLVVEMDVLAEYFGWGGVHFSY
jgi:hypothetical protein